MLDSITLKELHIYVSCVAIGTFVYPLHVVYWINIVRVSKHIVIWVASMFFQHYDDSANHRWLGVYGISSDKIHSGERELHNNEFVGNICIRSKYEKSVTLRVT